MGPWQGQALYSGLGVSKSADSSCYGCGGEESGTMDTGLPFRIGGGSFRYPVSALSQTDDGGRGPSRLATLMAPLQ